MSSPSPTFLSRSLSSLDQTESIAQTIAACLTQGDTILLAGEIGAGKTFFCRALIQSRVAVPEDVPSPSFTLVQTYDLDDAELWHVDLYRLSSTQDALDLGLEDAFEDAICLIEWPDRLGDLAPKSALHLTFTATNETTRLVRATLPPNDSKFENVLRSAGFE